MPGGHSHSHGPGQSCSHSHGQGPPRVTPEMLSKMPKCDCGTLFCVQHPDELVAKAMPWKDKPVADAYEAWKSGTDRLASVALLMHIRNPVVEEGKLIPPFNVPVVNELLDLGMWHELVEESIKLANRLVTVFEERNKIAKAYFASEEGKAAVEKAKAEAEASGGEVSTQSAHDAVRVPDMPAVPEDIDAHYTRFIVTFLGILVNYLVGGVATTASADVLDCLAKLKSLLKSDRALQKAVVAWRPVPDPAVRQSAVAMLHCLRQLDHWADLCGNPECSAVHPGGTAPRFQQCSGCKVVTYCSASCQKSHWKQHKPNCKALSELQRRQEQGLPLLPSNTSSGGAQDGDGKGEGGGSAPSRPGDVSTMG